MAPKAALSCWSPRACSALASTCSRWVPCKALCPTFLFSARPNACITMSSQSTITKASVEGQRSYWKAMASRTRAHIKEHASEFASEDVVDAENDDELDADDDDNAAAPWYERLTSGLVDTSDPAKLVLLVLVVLLVFSNLYLLLFRGGGGSSGSRTVVPKTPVPMSAGDNAELAARVERLEMAVLAMKGALERL